MSQSSYRRIHKCWVCDIPKLSPQQEGLIQILGTVVKLNATSLTIDDGTGSITVSHEHVVKGQIGEMVDIMFGVEDTAYIADTIVWKVTPQDETLRHWQLVEPPGEFGLPEAMKFDKHWLHHIIKHAGGGCSLEDLALVLDRSPKQIIPLIAELQEDASIYQNRNGEYQLL